MTRKYNFCFCLALPASPPNLNCIIRLFVAMPPFRIAIVLFSSLFSGGGLPRQISIKADIDVYTFTYTYVYGRQFKCVILSNGQMDCYGCYSQSVTQGMVVVVNIGAGHTLSENSHVVSMISIAIIVASSQPPRFPCMIRRGEKQQRGIFRSRNKSTEIGKPDAPRISDCGPHAIEI